MTEFTKKKCSICQRKKFTYEFHLNTQWCLDCARDTIAQKEMIDKILDTYGIDLNDPRIHRACLTSAEEGRCSPDIAFALGVETGSHRCSICETLHWERDEARDCCMPGVEEYWTWRIETYLDAMRERGGKSFEAYAVMVNSPKLVAALACTVGCEAGEDWGAARDHGAGRTRVVYAEVQKVFGVPTSQYRRWQVGTSWWMSREHYNSIKKILGEVPGCVPWPEGDPMPDEVRNYTASPQMRARVETIIRNQSEGSTKYAEVV